MRFVFCHHEQHGPFSLEDLCAGRVQYAGTVARLRVIFSLPARGIEVDLVGNVDDGQFAGVNAISGTGELEKLLHSCSALAPVMLILNNPPDKVLWPKIRELNRPGLHIALWAAGPYEVDWMRRLAAGDLDRIVCISQTQRDLYRLYPGFEKIEVVYLGIDLDLFPGVPAVRDTGCVVLSTSIPRRTKGIHHLLRAWHLVHEAMPQAKLRICGSARMHDPAATLGVTGILDADLEAEFPELFGDYPGSARRAGIELMGARSLPEVYRDIGAARVVVVNSNWRGSLEMFCRSAVEAQMAGVPVVGAARGSLPEVVAHGKTGLLVESEDPSALARAILTLLKNDDLRQRMGTAGPVWARPMADYGLIASQWEALAQRAFNGKRAPAPSRPVQDLLRRIGYGHVRLRLRDWLKP